MAANDLHELISQNRDEQVTCTAFGGLVIEGAQSQLGLKRSKDSFKVG